MLISVIWLWESDLVLPMMLFYWRDSPFTIVYSIWLLCCNLNCVYNNNSGLWPFWTSLFCPILLWLLEFCHIVEINKYSAFSFVLLKDEWTFQDLLWSQIQFLKCWLYFLLASFKCWAGLLNESRTVWWDMDILTAVVFLWSPWTAEFFSIYLLSI